VTTTRPVLEVRDLRVSVGDIPVVRGVSFALKPGERLAIVGESGSGKSLTALSIMGLHRAPVRVSGGEVLLDGVDLVRARRKELNQIRGRRISMIYQDPGAALNPIMSVGTQIAEAIRIHQPVSAAEARKRAIQLLDDVGIPDAARRIDAHAHEFSGGMRQRVMIAMALSCEPEVLLCDEPTTALDVTTQSLVMKLIDRVCTERQVATVLITHDLALAAGFCDNIAVMYGGLLMEQGPAEAVFSRPAHPYSNALMAGIVDLGIDVDAPLPAIAGQPPSLGSLTEGCPFRPRCPRAVDACAEDPLPTQLVANSVVRCVRPIRHGEDDVAAPAPDPSLTVAGKKGAQ
jgi:oligopeptide/dipeptide ABC transporter ATP-binding protein